MSKLTSRPKCKVDSLIDSANNNVEFLTDIFEADGDRKPDVLSSNVKIGIYAGTYYGWLVAKYGNDWRLHL